jgi:hypothetical protein
MKSHKLAIVATPISASNGYATETSTVIRG